ncbi:MAG: 30S ribosomal protein S16 [Candidatus Omnitrophica bacterium]|nr:30S ribosomal protein S16 [Candidatus Omnitrophota bacterium]
MSVKIRLRRIGKNPKGRPHFRIAVYDERDGRDSRSIEELGFYNPIEGKVKINKERFDFWIGKGALPTETVRSLVEKIAKEK